MKKFHNMTMTDTHVYFWRNNTPFSNFYRKPFLYKGHDERNVDVLVQLLKKVQKKVNSKSNESNR